MVSKNQKGKNEPQVLMFLGKYQAASEASYQNMIHNGIVSRIWAKDHTVWQPTPEEISNRLGWLDVADRMQDAIPSLLSLTEKLRREGFQKAVLLGMGGSSLAPEVFFKTFGKKKGFLELEILDSTDPGAILELDRRLSLAQTIFIVSSKSGTTTETLSFFKYFYQRVVDQLGKDHAGDHFIAITDPSSYLVELASRYQFQATFENDPNIGGRYSALSYFGLVPASLIGVDVTRLLRNAIATAIKCKDEENPAGYLGLILGEMASVGRDKLTFLLSPQITSFGEWLEQLIAESTGKSGKGILPVVGEPQEPVSEFGSDRLFVSIQLDQVQTDETLIDNLCEAGHPVIRIKMNELYDLGGQFFLWEFATAVAGYRMGIQPFDQPNVEAAKDLARKIIGEVTEKGLLPEFKPASITLEVMRSFLAQAKPGAYIAIQAYVKPDPKMDKALFDLRCSLRKYTGLATTTGYGPRFLHSTGQLHKGDAGNGLFIQLVSKIAEDANIPDETGKEASAITFGVLKNSQVLGDQQALLQAGRKVILFEIEANSVEEVVKLKEMITLMLVPKGK